MERLCIIGSGNVATQLATSLHMAGVKIVQVFSRTIEHAKELAQQLGCAYTNSWEQIDGSASLYIIAVRDALIPAVSEQLAPHCAQALVVHTSGATPMQAISARIANRGVFYPLQTFTKGRAVDMAAVPLLLEAEQTQQAARLANLAKQISSTVRFVDSEQRKGLHLSAVFINNFTNHLCTIAENICAERQQDVGLLMPLLQETVAKAAEIGPKNAQTGPAVRFDSEVINTHISMLGHQPLYQKIYRFVSESIFEQHGLKE